MGFINKAQRRSGIKKISNNLNRFFIAMSVNNYPINKAMEEMEVINSKTYKNLIKWQVKNKWKILEHHLRTNDFYSNYCDSFDKGIWEQIPVINKKDFKNSRYDFLSKSVQKNDLYKGKTSGSSGKPFIFWKDKYSHAITWASIWRSYNNLGIKVTDFQARFYAISLNDKNYWKERLKDWISNRYRFVIHDLSSGKLDSFLKKFENKRFTWVYGYSNSILEFSKYLYSSNIILKDICPTLKCCVVTAEMCNYETKSFISRQLGIPVYNEYGLSEFGIIAIDDTSCNWEISRDHLYIEILDNKGVPVRAGEQGNIVVTDLFNKAMPLIRYNTGDIGIVNSENTKLLSVIGRENDFLITKSGRKVPGFTFYYIIKDLLDLYPNILEYNIVQDNLDCLMFNFVVSSRPSNSLQQELSGLVQNYLGEKIKVSFNLVNRIDRSISGKTKHFVNLIDEFKS